MFPAVGVMAQTHAKPQTRLEAEHMIMPVSSYAVQFINIVCTMLSFVQRCAQHSTCRLYQLVLQGPAAGCPATYNFHKHTS